MSQIVEVLELKAVRGANKEKLVIFKTNGRTNEVPESQFLDMYFANNCKSVAGVDVFWAKSNCRVEVDMRKGTVRPK